MDQFNLMFINCVDEEKIFFNVEDLENIKINYIEKMHIYSKHLLFFKKILICHINEIVLWRKKSTFKYGITVNLNSYFNNYS